MKKLAILSPLVLLATTALAQDSTCILQPSCSQLGYTSAEADCGTAKVLRCPFDISQVACLSSGSDGGSGGETGGDNYNPYDPNNELGDVIAVKIKISAIGEPATFTYGGGNIYVDCGDGTIAGGSASSSGTVSCYYTKVGTYTVKLSGDFTYYGGSSPAATYLLKLDKSGITKMSDVCSGITSGIVPPLPSTLVDANGMFRGCTAINSPYPKLPATLEVADRMFYGTKFTGSVALPESLKSAESMFYENSGLESISGLENTQITDGSYMFYKCSSLTGTLNGLPSELTNGSNMFSYCSELIGSLNVLPSGLTDGSDMFYNCSGLTGNIPELPSGLTNGVRMFMGCGGLTGAAPAMPSNMTDCSYIFRNTSITYDNSWPDYAF
ncbi:MAG: leucine-rich repeat protein [Alphaproteobacteria bacterium]|nr:leucine-rich repeat protein [Alphaproteobacteria bacterium]